MKKIVAVVIILVVAGIIINTSTTTAEEVRSIKGAYNSVELTLDREISAGQYSLIQAESGKIVAQSSITDISKAIQFILPDKNLRDDNSEELCLYVVNKKYQEIVPSLTFIHPLRAEYRALQSNLQNVLDEEKEIERTIKSLENRIQKYQKEIDASEASLSQNESYKKGECIQLATEKLPERPHNAYELADAQMIAVVQCISQLVGEKKACDELAEQFGTFLGSYAKEVLSGPTCQVIKEKLSNGEYTGDEIVNDFFMGALYEEAKQAMIEYNDPKDPDWELIFGLIELSLIANEFNNCYQAAYRHHYAPYEQWQQSYQTIQEKPQQLLKQCEQDVERVTKNPDLITAAQSNKKEMEKELSAIVAEKESLRKQIEEKRQQVQILEERPCTKNPYIIAHGTLVGSPKFKLDGVWNSNVNFVYNLTWEGDKYTWYLPEIQEKGEIIITEKQQLKASWETEQSSGKSDGTIVKYDEQGDPLEIKWDDVGTIFKRKYSKTEASQIMERIKLEGVWREKAAQNDSQVTYNIVREGNKYTWYLPERKENGLVTIKGKSKLQASWDNENYSGATNGIITKFDARGRAMEIQWDVDSIFIRQDMNDTSEEQYLNETSQEDYSIPIAAGQIWTGYYICSQEKTSLTLIIESVSSPNRIDGIFDFNYQNGTVIGSLKVTGNYNSESRIFIVPPGEWIRRPEGYSAAGMTGVISIDGNHYTGKIEHPSCGEFALSLER